MLPDDIGFWRFKNHGFTLLEICACLALAGVIAVLGLSSLRVHLEEARLENAAARVTALLVRARAGAVHEDRIWRVAARENRLHVSAGERHSEVVRMPAGVRVALNSGGDVQFHPDGYAENGTFRLTNAFGERVVVLNQRGRVRLP